jgi:MFS family permease
LSVAVFAVFYREPGPREHRAAPFRLRELLRSRPWLFATGFAWVFMGALGCVVAYTTAALHQDAGMGAVRAGLMLALLQVGGAAGRIGWGVLSDRLGGRGPVMALAGFLATLACLGAAAGFRPGTPGWFLAPLVFLLGAAALGWNGLYVTLSAEVGSQRGAATAVGAGTTITFTGLFVAPPIFGAIADRTGAYRWSWVALAAFCAVGTVLGLAIRDRRRRLRGPPGRGRRVSPDPPVPVVRAGGGRSCPTGPPASAPLSSLARSVARGALPCSPSEGEARPFERLRPAALAQLPSVPAGGLQ